MMYPDSYSRWTLEVKCRKLAICDRKHKDLPIYKNTEVLLIHVSLNFRDPLVADGSRGDYQSGSRNNGLLCAVITNHNSAYSKGF
jgi:hypothetical protein